MTSSVIFLDRHTGRAMEQDPVLMGEGSEGYICGLWFPWLLPVDDIHLKLDHLMIDLLLTRRLWENIKVL